jgi:hypothetical protein
MKARHAAWMLTAAASLLQSMPLLSCRDIGKSMRLRGVYQAAAVPKWCQCKARTHRRSLHRCSSIRGTAALRRMGTEQANTLSGTQADYAPQHCVWQQEDHLCVSRCSIVRCKRSARRRQEGRPGRQCERSESRRGRPPGLPRERRVHERHTCSHPAYTDALVAARVLAAARAHH